MFFIITFICGTILSSDCWSTYLRFFYLPLFNMRYLRLMGRRLKSVILLKSKAKNSLNVVFNLLHLYMILYFQFFLSHVIGLRQSFLIISIDVIVFDYSISNTTIKIILTITIWLMLACSVGGKSVLQAPILTLRLASLLCF